MNTEKKVSILLVGVGGYGGTYIDLILKHSDRVRLVGGIETNEIPQETIDKLSEHNPRFYKSMEDFYAENAADLCIICTPIHLHKEHTLCALRHGSNVLCEKPVAGCVKDAEEMINTQTDKFVAVGFQHCFADNILSLKRDILAGVWGKPILAKSINFFPRPMWYFDSRNGYSHTSVFRTIAFIGDSLSSGEFETRDENGKPGYHDLYEYSWGQYIARNNGLKAYNFSRGGMTAKEYVESFAEENGLWDRDKACQAYVIALGVNDIYNRNMEIGSVADIDDENYLNNKPTFVGYYATIIKRYKEISPDAKFFFVTFPNSNTPHRDDKTHGMINALYSLADRYDNSYVIDLYKYGPVYDKEFEQKFYLYGHMNASGYILTARMIDSYMDYIVRHNPDDFKTVGFIGTDIKYK